MPGIASSSPAGADRPPRRGHVDASALGSGGVMLPNHAPLVGRRAVRHARGAAPRPHRPRHRPRAGHRPAHRRGAARAVRGRSRADDFPEQLARAARLLRRRVAEGHPYAASPRCPARATSPRSGCSARATYSAQAGRRCSACRSRSPTTSRRRNTIAALDVYRRRVPPSADLDAPYVMLGVSVRLRARPTSARAWLAGPGACRSSACVRAGPTSLPDARGGGRVQVHADRAGVRPRRGPRSHVVGDPADVRRGSPTWSARTGADELMVSTMVHGHADRLRSYELVAEVERDERRGLTASAPGQPAAGAQHHPDHRRAVWPGPDPSCQHDRAPIAPTGGRIHMHRRCPYPSPAPRALWSRLVDD